MIANVQMMRALAAFLVVWFHAREVLTPDTIPHWLPVGMSGVDMFFIVSGFVMAYSTAGKDVAPMDFLVRRLVRVAPLYYLFVIFTASVWLASPSLLNSTSVDAESLIKTLLFIPYMKSEGRLYPILFVGWTLNYEMLFYLIFTFGLAIYSKYRVHIATAITLLLVAIGTQIDGLEYGAVPYAFTRPVMLDFVLGMVLASAYPHMARIAERHGARPFALLFAAGGSVLFFLDCLSWKSDVIAPDTHTFFRYGLAAFVMIGGAVGLEAAGYKIRNRFLLQIGDASYSLYLLHFFVAGFAIALVHRFDPPMAIRILALLLTLAAAVGLALMFHKLVEKPIGRAFKRITPSKRPALAAE